MHDSELVFYLVSNDDDRATVIQDGLRDFGYRLIFVVPSLAAIANQVDQQSPDVVIIDDAFPTRVSLRDSFAFAESLGCTVVMFVGAVDDAAARASIDHGVSAFIVDGLARNRVGSIITVARARHQLMSGLKSDLETAAISVNDADNLERAKSILLNTKGFSEEQAYVFLRSAAMNARKSIGEVAAMLVESSKK